VLAGRRRLTTMTFSSGLSPSIFNEPHAPFDEMWCGGLFCCPLFFSPAFVPLFLKDLVPVSFFELFFSVSNRHAFPLGPAHCLVVPFLLWKWFDYFVVVASAHTVRGKPSLFVFFLYSLHRLIRPPYPLVDPAFRRLCGWFLPRLVVVAW